MLDHVFTDAIGSLRDSLESALLERQAFEERFQTDVLLGDVSWETSYGLPGESSPPRVQVDITLEWPTWSQTSYRNWYLHEDYTEPASIEIEVIFRIQHLVNLPDPKLIVESLPQSNPVLNQSEFINTGLILEVVYDTDMSINSHAAEVSYNGAYDLDESTLEDGSTLDKHFADLGSWITSTLVRLGDLPLVFSTPEE